MDVESKFDALFNNFFLLNSFTNEKREGPNSKTKLIYEEHG